MPFAAPLLTGRATDIIAARCREVGGTVLLPALYCTEVADAIEAAGCNVRCYDLRPDLSAGIVAPTGDVRAVVWHHPFGYYLPPPRLPGVALIEDACFSLRTVLAMSTLAEPELIVFSPRKEFGWANGGLAIGSRAEALRNAVSPPGQDLVMRWHTLNPRMEVGTGLAAGAHARRQLGDRLPSGANALGEDVLTLLPLLSARRDEVIESLRSNGVAAWCWQRPMAGCTPHATPQAWEIWRRLLLVPVPAVGSPIYGLLASHDFDPWPD